MKIETVNVGPVGDDNSDNYKLSMNGVIDEHYLKQFCRRKMKQFLPLSLPYTKWTKPFPLPSIFRLKKEPKQKNL